MIHVRTRDENLVNYRSAEDWLIDDHGRLHVLAGDKSIAVYNADWWTTVARVEDQSVRAA